MQHLMKNYRTLFLFRGLAALAFGAIALIWPNLTLSVLVLLFGIFALVTGISAVASALQNRTVQGWGFHLLEGTGAILIGTVALVWPGITAFAFLFLLAAWAIMTGTLEFIAPLSLPMSGGRAALLVLSGLVSIIFGIVIAAQPVSGLLAVVWMIGMYAIVIGVLHLVTYFEARSAIHEASQAQRPHIA